jgi:hypothetical protein
MLKEQQPIENQPVSLSALAKITYRPSMSWAEQRRYLGFPARM